MYLKGICSVDDAVDRHLVNRQQYNVCSTSRYTEYAAHISSRLLGETAQGLSHRNDDIQNDLHVVYSARQQIYLPVTCTLKNFKCIPQESWVKDIHRIGQTVLHNYRDIAIVM